MAAASAAMTALLRPSTSPHFLDPKKHRLSPRFPRLCSFSLPSSTPQSLSTTPQNTLEAQPKLAITNVVDILSERGLVDSMTSDNLRSVCSNPNCIPLKVYCGFDPTAESLQLGNLIGMVVLSWFRRCGHKTIAVIGGATGRVGDPSGKSLERPELNVETVEKNRAGIRALVYKILHRASVEVDLEMGCIKDEYLNPETNEYCNCLVVEDNFNWWKDITLLDFLGEVGRYARVGTMMAKDSVKRRLMSEQGISFTEFTYQLLQGYDFLHMFKNMGVNVQIGGSDQWGNITAGTELIQKILQVEGAYGLTFPLLLNNDGSKFGKSEGGSIWLSPDMMPPYKFYQYFLSVPNEDVGRFLKLFTFLNLKEIQVLEETMKKPGYAPKSAQRRLAEEVTRFVHGAEGLAEAMKATEALKPGVFELV
ncbi:hypothetical protein M5K25_006337 [Dendrobium thyrsiflorum]|uniref:Tyrosine--tRNA ligase n=1 Tax=Dendrobium thyrsiflorum TaxID=117978 RepID=A0ABD0VCK3_DENTH